MEVNAGKPVIFSVIFQEWVILWKHEQYGCSLQNSWYLKILSNCDCQKACVILREFSNKACFFIYCTHICIKFLNSNISFLITVLNYFLSMWNIIAIIFYCVSSLLNLLKLFHVFVSINSYEKSSWGWNDKKKKEEMTEDKAW